MPSINPANPLIVVVGPTAAGKTALALDLAERFRGEIISADSRQFYIGMDIGTAKPIAEELHRVPHHMVDIAWPDQTVGLSDFQRLAFAAITGILQRGRLPFLVGGTGQYVRAVIEGWKIPKQPPDAALRGAIQRWGAQIGAQGLHQRLSRLDPPAAALIQPQNVRRTVRALEVIFSSGRRFSEQRRKERAPYDCLVIGVWRERKQLYARIDERVDAMIAAGLLEETRSLLEQGYSPHLPAFSAIGYGEMLDVLRGDYRVSEAAVIMKRRTREYVRRQANWFKETDPQIHWLNAEEDILAQAQRLISRFLEGALRVNHTDEENI